MRRILYGFELWSVLKVSLLFYFCVWAIFLLAGVLLWSFAVSSGYIERFENFILEIFNYETFVVNGSEIFDWYVLAGLFGVLIMTALTVVLCLIYNLISVLVGGVRLTLVEEETVRLQPRRRIFAEKGVGRDYGRPRGRPGGRPGGRTAGRMAARPARSARTRRNALVRVAPDPAQDQTAVHASSSQASPAQAPPAQASPLEPAAKRLFRSRPGSLRSGSLRSGSPRPRLRPRQNQRQNQRQQPPPNQPSTS